MLSDRAVETDEARIAPRTNMFIAAMMHSASGACPVRVRNLSRSGAMIEAPVLPPQGAAIELVRHDLRVTGAIVWTAGGRCGVHLDSTVAVAEWMANSANRQQSRVDQMVAEIKGGLTGPAAPAPAPAPTPALLPATDICEDIERLRLLLDAMGDDLADSPETLMRHAASLQHLDIAGQMLDALKLALDPDAERRDAGLFRLLSLRPSSDMALGKAV